MNKECVNKLECRYPTLFKAMWISVALWLIMSIANYFGHWLLQWKLDDFGMGIIIMFAVSLIICFGGAMMNLLKEKGDLFLLQSKAKSILSYSFLASFVVLLLFSMLDLCLSADYHTDYTRNGGIQLIPAEPIVNIVSNFIISAIVSVAAVVSYGFIRICLMLFLGRIKRIGIEIALAVVLIVSFSVCIIDQPWINILVVLVAVFFLYDIWQLADFKEEQVSWDAIKKFVNEDD